MREQRVLTEGIWNIREVLVACPLSYDSPASDLEGWAVNDFKCRGEALSEAKGFGGLKHFVKVHTH